MECSFVSRLIWPFHPVREIWCRYRSLHLPVFRSPRSALNVSQKMASTRIEAEICSGVASVAAYSEAAALRILLNRLLHVGLSQSGAECRVLTAEYRFPTNKNAPCLNVPVQKSVSNLCSLNGSAYMW